MSWDSLSGQRGRLLELDGARGLGAILVVSWHYFAMQLGVHPPWTIPFCTARFLSLAVAMMDMFFVVSGFLIGGIILDHRASPNLFRVFYLRRALRILPPYLLLLLASLLLRITWPAFRELDLRFFEGTIPWWSYLTFTQNFFQMTRNALGTVEVSMTWTVALEEQFYVFMPLLIYVVPQRRLPLVLLVGMTISPIVRLCYPDVAGLENTIIGRSDPFCLGVLLAIVARTPAALQWVTAHKRALRIVTHLLMLLLLATAIRSFRAAFGAWIYCLWSWAWAAVCLSALTDSAGLMPRILRWRPLVWFGEISYGLYLYHWIVCSVLMMLLRGTKVETYDAAMVLTLIASFLVAALLAALSYYAMERPLLFKGHEFKYEPAARRSD